MPSNNYSITAQRNNQKLDMLHGDSIYINKSKTFAVPVVKTFTQKGRLKEIKAEYDITIQDASGISIYAQNTQTEKPIIP
ncbi:hypothetical protein KRR40_03270 [Niabella defluvii]|nr:hypothetical protein KRR40_03270 [Niabella sp. I65]